jgi:hypothetical protein
MLNGLDILTPKGQQSAAHELDAVNLWMNRWPGFQYAHTPKDKPVAIDAMIIKDGKIVAGVEVKCRYRLSLHQFRTTFNSEWLVTAQKLDDCAAICSMLHIPLVGFLYLVDDRTLLHAKLYENGQWIIPMRRERSVTQRTINGGSIERENAYIDMINARVIEPC